jgi:uncharacterized protein (UPF0332 family)
MNIVSIKDEWKRAEKALQAAKMIHKAGLFEDSVSRTYYAVMHAAKSVLLACETTVESHAAIRRQFGKALIKPGLIEPEWATILGTTQDERMLADYNAGTNISSESAQCLINDADRFLQRMEKFLISRGISVHDEEQNKKA